MPAFDFDLPTGQKPPSPWSTVLGFLTLLAIVACGVGLWVGVPIVQQYPSKVATPPSVLGLAQITNDPELDFLAERVERGKENYGDHSQFVAAYTDAQHTQFVLVVAGTDFIPARESSLDKAIGKMTDATDEVGEFHEVDAGDLDGIAKCAYFRFKEWGKGRGVLCGWTDHGSFGLVFFVPADDIDTAARKLLDVRFAVETR